MHFVDKAREQLARPLRYKTDLEQLAWDSLLTNCPTDQSSWKMTPKFEVHSGAQNDDLKSVLLQVAETQS